MSNARKKQQSKQQSAPEKGPSKVRLFVTVGLIVIVVGTIAGFGLWKPSADSPADPATTPPVSATPVLTPGAAPSATPTAGNPKPYEYDAANNRHWDPAHGHWHPGAPPNATSNFGDASLLNPAAQTPATATAGQPEPLEYDEANNRHWNPAHGHWHPSFAIATSRPTRRAAPPRRSSGSVKKSANSPRRSPNASAATATSSTSPRSSPTCLPG